VIERIVVLRRDDEALLAEVNSAKATAVQPEADPPDMRCSVQYALAKPVAPGDQEKFRTGAGCSIPENP
jgi:hypothetical protein